MKAPVSSLSVSSCFSSTVTALSQSTAAISMSVVLFISTAPKKSVALKPDKHTTARYWEGPWVMWGESCAPAHLYWCEHA